MKRRWLGVAVAAAAALSPAAWAATPITISAAQSLAFGSFVAGTGGTITISSAGVRTQGGGVVAVPSSSAAAALFNVSGTPSVTYTVTLPADGTVTLSNGANTMAVDTFTSNPSAAAASSGMLGTGGTQTLAVGATLRVGSGQPSGSYSGSFSVTVNYP